MYARRISFPEIVIRTPDASVVNKLPDVQTSDATGLDTDPSSRRHRLHHGRAANLCASLSARAFKVGRGCSSRCGFAAHPFLTFLHILPAALLICLMPLQFVSRIRARHSAWHRWSGRLLVAFGFVVGTSALVMSYLWPSSARSRRAPAAAS